MVRLVEVGVDSQFSLSCTRSYNAGGSTATEFYLLFLTLPTTCLTLFLFSNVIILLSSRFITSHPVSPFPLPSGEGLFFSCSLLTVRTHGWMDVLVATPVSSG